MNLKCIKGKIRNINHTLLISGVMGVTLFALNPTAHASSYNINDRAAVARTGGHSSHSSHSSKSSSTSSSKSSVPHTYGGGGSSSTVPRPSVNHSTRNLVGRTANLNSNSDVVGVAKRIDYYHTSNHLLRNILIFGALYSIFHNNTSHAENAEVDNNTSSVENNNVDNNTIPSEEEFKKSVERLSEESDYLSNVKVEDLTEEEKLAIYKDYETVTSYMNANKAKDYKELYDAALKSNFAKALVKKDKKDFVIESIELKEEEQKKYLSLNMALDNEPVEFRGDPFLANIYDNIENQSETQFSNNLDRLVNDKVIINLDKKTFSLKNRYIDALVVISSIGGAALVGTIAYSMYRDIRSDNNSKEKLKIKK